eukprot:1257758-Rhodomonas_salina.1
MEQRRCRCAQCCALLGRRRERREAEEAIVEGCERREESGGSREQGREGRAHSAERRVQPGRPRKQGGGRREAAKGGHSAVCLQRLPSAPALEKGVRDSGVVALQRVQVGTRGVPGATRRCHGSLGAASQPATRCRPVDGFTPPRSAPPISAPHKATCASPGTAECYVRTKQLMQKSAEARPSAGQDRAWLRR